MLKYYAIAHCSLPLLLNDIKFGYSSSDNLGEVILDIIEEETDIEYIKRYILKTYGKIDLDSVSSYYEDGDVLISVPIRINH